MPNRNSAPAWVACIAFAFAFGGSTHAGNGTPPPPSQPTPNTSAHTNTTAPPQTAVSPTTQRQSRAEQHNLSEVTSHGWTVFGLKPPDVIMGGSTLALFIATACLVWITRDSGRRQLRAYLLVEGCGLRYHQTPMAHLTVRNFGQTPAYDVQTWVGTKGDEYPLRTPLLDASDDIAQSTSIIGPGSFEESIVPVTEPTPPQWVQIRAEKAALYVWGYVRYRDAFKMKRILRFRLMLHGDHAADAGRFVNCEDGNYAD